MWRQLFGNNGAINAILDALGLPTTSWLGNPNTAIWTLIVLFGWQFGSSMLIFLAGLKNIPQEFYEAASVDGANGWYRFSRITIPLLTPVILFNLVMQLISGFLSFIPSFIITERRAAQLDFAIRFVLVSARICIFRHGLCFRDGLDLAAHHRLFHGVHLQQFEILGAL